jgi:8-oxo-dGTP pyrophosphatase MutT (NUDIX family)
MLVRDAKAPAGDVPGRLEVLMVKRHALADFVGGAHVFPGGGVDAEDGADEARTASAGRSDAGANEVLGVSAGGLAYWVAAIRECFEEAGILLAYRDTAPSGEGRDRSVLSLEDPADEQRLHHLRSEVNAGRRSFLDVCRAERLLLACDLVHYFAHWITPEPSPRRYDTRFFVAAAPDGQVPLPDEREIVDEVWIRPADALRRHREGEIDLVLPTVRCLRAMTGFDRAHDLLAAVATASRMVADSHGVRVALPGDAGIPDAAAWAPRR